MREVLLQYLLLSLKSFSMDEKLIIYLALSTLIQNCMALLEDTDNTDKDEIDMVTNLLIEAEKIIVKYESEIDDSKPISKPSW